MQDPIIEFKNVSIRIREKAADRALLKGLNLVIQRGSCMGLVGESGSGKSLTALSLLGLLPSLKAWQTEGEIRFSSTDGIRQNLLGLSESEWLQIRGKKIAMVFQEPMSALNPVMRCGEQLLECIDKTRPKKERMDYAMSRIEQVKIKDVQRAYHAYPHELSGGQKQRMMIAMAMAQNPELIICDEPTTALDVSVQKAVLDLLHDLRTEHRLSMLFISHDLALVKDMCTDVSVMLKGELVESGDASVLLAEPSNAYTKALINCRPPGSGKPERLLTVADFFKNPQISYRDIPQMQKQETGNLLVKAERISAWFEQEGFLRNRPGPSILQNISLEIHRQESVGLAGESGSGKSTLARVLCGLMKTWSGTLVWKNNEPWPNRRSGKIQLVFQDPVAALNPSIRIGEVIRDAYAFHHPQQSGQASKAAAISLLEKTGLDATAYNRYPHAFSGGQRQRIVIARALAAEPELLICDESVAALDVSVQATVLNLLHDLKKEKKFALLFISHDLPLLRYFCDRMLILEKGRIVEEGLSDSVFFAPAHPYTKFLMQAIPGQK